MMTIDPFNIWSEEIKIVCYNSFYDFVKSRDLVFRNFSRNIATG